ncbi:MAG: hypothetical protein OD811_05655 [Alphaproteobacteria bacterium]
MKHLVFLFVVLSPQAAYAHEAHSGGSFVHWLSSWHALAIIGLFLLMLLFAGWRKSSRDDKVDKV